MFLVALFMAFIDSMAAKQGRRPQHSEESCESTWLKGASEEVRSPSLTSLHMPGRWCRTRWCGTTLAPPQGANLSCWPPAQPQVLMVVGARQVPRTTRSLCIHPATWKGDGPTAAPAAAVSVSQVAQAAPPRAAQDILWIGGWLGQLLFFILGL